MASFDAEWAQIKRETSAAPGMKLASAEGRPGGACGVKSDKAAWSAAASSVGALAGNVKKALTALKQGQKGLDKGDGAGGVESAAAQHEVYGSWKRYLDDVQGRCRVLQEPLEKAGHDQFKNDEATKGAFDKVGDRYQDTPAIGGQSRGR
ncbi:hypothetical protein AB0I22_12290 [Streptomyces sp. NPDC050610]|uniref:hypothetical protein n=1 Tax=Streptomyces sp. NPDC050610 TaxID=3157097 RepID=UPI00342E133C